MGEHEVINLRGHQAGRPLDLPSWALLFLSVGLPSVAGGPADPGTWDAGFGDHSAQAEGDAEAQARSRKAMALPSEVAALYVEARILREGGRIEADRLRALKLQALNHPAEWLLLAEVAELEAELDPGLPETIEVALKPFAV